MGGVSLLVLPSIRVHSFEGFVYVVLLPEYIWSENVLLIHELLNSADFGLCVLGMCVRGEQPQQAFPPLSSVQVSAPPPHVVFQFSVDPLDFHKKKY